MNTFSANSSRLCFVALSILLSLLANRVLTAQTPYTPDIGNVGLPANGVFHGGSIDTVQLNNGNVHIDIPLLHLPGIGLDTDIHLTYDSLVWNQATGPVSQTSSFIWTLVTMSRPPWQLKDPLTGYLKRGQHTLNWNCAQISGNPNEGAGQNTDIDFTSFIDEDGSAHPLPLSGLLPSGSSPVCALNGITGNWPTLDTTGDSNNGYYPVYSIDQAGYNYVADNNGNPVHFYDRHGTSFTFSSSSIGSASGLPAPLASTGNSCSGGACGSTVNPGGATNISYIPVVSAEDSNGNKISKVVSGTSTTIVDTVNRHILETYTAAASCPTVPTSPAPLPVMTDALVQTPNTIQYTDQNGTTQTITICYGLAPVSLEPICQTSTACGSTLGENTVTGSIVVPTSVALQNGDRYTFSYTPNPGDTYSMGEITSITLPTGGTISYTYGAIAPGFAGRQVISRTVTANGQSGTWKYDYAYTPGDQGVSSAATVTVTDPYSNDTVYTCTQSPTGLALASGVPPCYMVSEISYNGEALAGAPLVSKTTGYTLVGASLMPTSEIVTWNSSGTTTETDTSWDSFTPPVHANYWVSGLGVYASALTLGNTMSKTVYDYGSGAHGNLISNTQYAYLHQGSTSYVAKNILDRVSKISVYNSATQNSSTLVSQTTTGYDSFTQGGQSGLASTSGSATTQHDYTNYGTGNLVRGLPTSVVKYVGSSSSIANYTNYNDLGKPTVTVDGRGHLTTYAYGTQNAFPHHQREPRHKHRPPHVASRSEFESYIVHL